MSLFNVIVYPISQTQDQHEKNEIFVVTIGSTTGGAITGYALGLLFMTTPVGWGVALVLGTAASIGSYAAGKGAVWFYDRTMNHYDLVNTLRVDQICK